MGTIASDSFYNLQEIAGRGRGLVAATAIAKGTRILSEAPLFEVPRAGNAKDRLRKLILETVQGLNNTQRQQFLELHNSFEEDGPEFGRIRTNALPLGTNAAKGGLFLNASRINHSCLQNAQNTWNETLQELTIHAIRDIAKGEEIAIFYLMNRPNRVARQEALKSKFGFTCSCSLCSLPSDECKKSDKRCDEIIRLDEKIGDGMSIFSAPLQTLHNVHQILNWLDDEGIADATVPRAYYDAFQIAVTHSDAARAKIFAQRAAAARIVLEGKDSPTVRKMESYAEDPSRHLAYGYTGKWRTSTDSIPKELDKDSFERWLWKKEETKAFQYANLRSDSHFPSFKALPTDNDINMEYHSTVDGFSYSPIKHWCFFGEITDIERIIRLKLIVKDKTGHQIPVAFYTDLAGNEINLAYLQQGFTIAILYAEQHGFLDFTVGIRLERIGTIKILPFPINMLFDLSDKIQRYSKTFDGLMKCQGCEKKAASLQKCARCGLFWYCNKSCQRTGWDKKGHKIDCKHLKDPDLKNMFLQNWNVFDNYFQYSII